MQLAGGTMERRVPLEPSGRFLLPTLPAGDCTVFVDGPQARSAKTTVRIEPGLAAGPIHLVLEDVPFLHGRVIPDDKGIEGLMIVLHGENSWRGMGLSGDGDFQFGWLDKEVYTLTLTRDGKDLQIEPSTFDLTDGTGRENVVVRIVGR